MKGNQGGRERMKRIEVYSTYFEHLSPHINKQILFKLLGNKKSDALSKNKKFLEEISFTYSMSTKEFEETKTLLL